MWLFFLLHVNCLDWHGYSMSLVQFYSCWCSYSASSKWATIKFSPFLWNRGGNTSLTKLQIQCLLRTSTGFSEWGKKLKSMHHNTMAFLTLWKDSALCLLCDLEWSNKEELTTDLLLPNMWLLSLTLTPKCQRVWHRSIICSAQVLAATNQMNELLFQWWLASWWTNQSVWHSQNAKRLQHIHLWVNNAWG